MAHHKNHTPRARMGPIRFGVVTAWPREDWHSLRLAAACNRLGVATTVDPAALAAFVGDGPVRVTLDGHAASAFDALLLVRGLGRAGDADVQFEIYRALEGSGAIVANRIDALLAAQDKLRTSWLLRQAGVATPLAAVAQMGSDALAALAALRLAVMKPIAGSLGEGLQRVTDDPVGRRRVEDEVARNGSVYLQAWVDHPGRDARLFVVGGRVEAAMERIAAPGEWRTNVERGARLRALDPDGASAVLAVRAARVLGLDWAGVDVVDGPDGPTVLEVNGNPSWAGILDATGKDMAEPIAEHVWARAQRQVGRTDLTQERAHHGG